MTVVTATVAAPTPLRALRLARLLTLRDLAALAGVTPLTLLTAELGRRRPSLTTIRRLSTALEIAPMDCIEFRAALQEASE